MISKQSKGLLLVGVICLGSALIWQNYSHLAFELSHRSPRAEAKGPWTDLHEYHPPLSNVLFLVGTFGLLLVIPSAVGDIVRWRRHR